jgi:hypothetical protein
MLPYTKPLNRALNKAANVVNSCPSNIISQLPGNIGTGIRSEPIVKIEKKVIIISPFKFIPSLID